MGLHSEADEHVPPGPGDILSMSKLVYNLFIFYFKRKDYYHLKCVYVKGCCAHWQQLENRIATLEFDRERKSMSVIVISQSGKRSILKKDHV